MRVLSVAFIVALTVGACGGSAAPAATAPSELPTPSANDAMPMASPPTPTPSPSPTASDVASPSPSPTPALKTVRDLIAEKHPKVSAKAAQAAIAAAYEADDKALSVFPYGMANTACFDGEGQDQINARAAWLARQAECPGMVSNLFGVYAAHGTVEFYDAALATYNYFVNYPFKSWSSPGGAGSKQQAIEALKTRLLADWPS